LLFDNFSCAVLFSFFSGFSQFAIPFGKDPMFMACLHGIQVFGWIDRWFATLRKNRKGLGVSELFKQGLCVMVDGASRRLYFLFSA
jgi:hypothetical protein